MCTRWLAAGSSEQRPERSHLDTRQVRLVVVRDRVYPVNLVQLMRW